MPILCRCEVVREGRVAWYWTLCDSIDAVHFVGAELADAVPVNCCAVVTIMVSNMHNNLITPTGLNDGPWVSPVEGYSIDLWLAVWRELLEVSALYICTQFMLDCALLAFCQHQ
jgi:hypothetical protein